MRDMLLPVPCSSIGYRDAHGIILRRSELPGTTTINDISNSRRAYSMRRLEM